MNEISEKLRKKVYNFLTLGAIDNADLDGMAFIVEEAANTIYSLTTRIEDAEWRVIGSAPMDGTVVDLLCIHHLNYNKPLIRITNRKYGPCKNWMGNECMGWGLSEDYEPTHWMPIPKNPIKE